MKAKKFLALLMATTMVASFTACGSADEPAAGATDTPGTEVSENDTASGTRMPYFHAFSN